MRLAMYGELQVSSAATGDTAARAKAKMPRTRAKGVVPTRVRMRFSIRSDYGEVSTPLDPLARGVERGESSTNPGAAGVGAACPACYSDVTFRPGGPVGAGSAHHVRRRRRVGQDHPDGAPRTMAGTTRVPGRADGRARWHRVGAGHPRTVRAAGGSSLRPR